MHEFSLCQNIIEIVTDEFKKLNPQPRRIIKVNLVIGKLHGVVKENMHFAYEVLAKDTAAQGSQLEIDEIPIKAKCRMCNWQGAITNSVFLCANCASGNLDIEEGKEFYIKDLEVEEDE
jgi:hydrogenase nickel incorporation protein HypA/HybF